MDKYTVKAIGTVVGLAAGAVTVALITTAILNFFQPTAEQGIFAMCMIVLGYTAYNLIKIQADIYRSRDKLNK